MSDNVSYELQQIRQILERIANATPVAPDVNVTVEGSGGVSDGDKGALTVAGDVWTMNNAANPSWLTALAWSKLTSVPSTFAPSSHTHPLSELTASGASINDVATFDGTNWVPAAPSGSGIGGTLGSTDNALTRADGTGGSTAQGSSVTLSDAGQITGPFWDISTATYSGRTFTQVKAVGTNISVHVAPTGTGGLTANLPDGTSAGGNARGTYSVDWQLSRPSAFRVAGGESSTIGGGFGNTASGRYSCVPGGAQCSASGESSFASGEGSAASGTRSTALNNYTVASGYGSLASGNQASATLYGQRAHSSGGATRGQLCEFTLHRDTTDATPSNLFLDNSSARLVVPANSSGCAMISVTARTATAGAETMTWRRRVNWQRGVGVGTVTVDVETVGTDRGYTGGAWGAGPAWSLSITADTTNGAINVIGTGAAATNIRWIAEIQWGEVTFA